MAGIETRRKPYIATEDEYVDFLKNYTFKSYEHDMLMAHADALILSASQLAAAAGRSSFRFANRRYGGLGGKIAEYLNLTLPKRKDGSLIKINALAEDVKVAVPTTDGDYQSEIHPELVRAIQRVGELQVEGEPRKRNPPWIRDELILALDLYMSNPISPPGKDSRVVAELSETLNAMGQLLGRGDLPKYRNANGVYMNMMNFRRFDPDYRSAGRKGLTRGNRLEEEVWNKFAGDPDRLVKVAAAIRAAVAEFPAGSISETEEDDQTEAAEGQLLTRLHRYRERDRKLVKKRKTKHSLVTAI